MNSILRILAIIYYAAGEEEGHQIAGESPLKNQIWSMPRLGEVFMITNDQQHEHHIFARGLPHQANLRGLATASAAQDTGSHIRSKPQLIDDFNDLEEMEAPDIWDILIWIGAWIGRVTRMILVGLIKLGYALYTGMVYGWESAKQEDVVIPN